MGRRTGPSAPDGEAPCCCPRGFQREEQVSGLAGCRGLVGPRAGHGPGGHPGSAGERRRGFLRRGRPPVHVIAGSRRDLDLAGAPAGGGLGRRSRTGRAAGQRRRHRHSRNVGTGAGGSTKYSAPGVVQRVQDGGQFAVRRAHPVPDTIGIAVRRWAFQAGTHLVAVGSGARGPRCRGVFWPSWLGFSAIVR